MLPQFRLTTGDMKWGQEGICDLGCLIPCKKGRERVLASGILSPKELCKEIRACGLQKGTLREIF